MASKQRVGLRFTDKQWNRLMQIKDRARLGSKGYAPLTDLVKELMGAIPYNLTNESERSFLLSGKLPPLAKVEEMATPIAATEMRPRNK